MLEGKEEGGFRRGERAVWFLGEARLRRDGAEVEVVGEGDAVAGSDGQDLMLDVAEEGDVCD